MSHHIKPWGTTVVVNSGPGSMAKTQIRAAAGCCANTAHKQATKVSQAGGLVYQKTLLHDYMYGLVSTLTTCPTTKCGAPVARIAGSRFRYA